MLAHEENLSVIEQLLASIIKLTGDVQAERQGLPGPSSYAHINHPAPSLAARNGKLLSNQNSTSPHAVFNGRPITVAGPHLSIYHPIFQTFMREYSLPVDPAGFSQEDILSASDLMVNSASYYEDENDRLRIISNNLAHFLDIQWEGAFVSEARKWIPDGNIKATCPLVESGGVGALSPAILFFQLTNGIGDGHADPVEQAQHDYFLLCTSSRAGAFDWLNDWTV